MDSGGKFANFPPLLSVKRSQLAKTLSARAWFFRMERKTDKGPTVHAGSAAYPVRISFAIFSQSLDK